MANHFASTRSRIALCAVSQATSDSAVRAREHRAVPGILTVVTDASRIGSESDLFSAFLGGSHAERLTVEPVDRHPGQRGRTTPRCGFWYVSAIQWIVTAKLVQPTDGPAVTAAVRLYNRTTAMARGAVVDVTSPHADFHGSPRLALDDSLAIGMYSRGGSSSETSAQTQDSVLACTPGPGEFVKPR